MAVVRNGVESYKGRVLMTYTRDHRVMSDIYAPVTYARVIEDDGATREVHVKAHFELDTSNATATADATPAWKTLSEVYMAKSAAERRMGEAEAMAKAAAKPVAASYPEPRKGDLVMVTGKTKGVEKGELVEVVWTGTSKFSGAARVGLMVNGERVYAPASKVTRVATADEMEVAEAAAAKATEVRRAEAAAEMVKAKGHLATASAAYAAALAAVATKAAA